MRPRHRCASAATPRSRARPPSPVGAAALLRRVGVVVGRRCLSGVVGGRGRLFGLTGGCGIGHVAAAGFVVVSATLALVSVLVRALARALGDLGAVVAASIVAFGVLVGPAVVLRALIRLVVLLGLLGLVVLLGLVGLVEIGRAHV